MRNDSSTTGILPPRIAGMETATALGPDLEAFSRGLRNGTSGLIAHGDGQSVASAGFAFARPCDGKDPLGRFLADLVLRAFARTDLPPELATDRDTILVVATTKGDISGLLDPPGEVALGPFLSRIRRALGHDGYAELVSCACASGTAAIARAVDLLTLGRGKRAVVIGFDMLDRFVVAGFSHLGASSPTGARPFDDDRDGMTVGEAAAAILLTIDNLPGIRVTGTGLSGDARTILRPAEDGSGLVLAMKRAIATLNGPIDAICVHGTGTPANDAMEHAAFLEFFGTVPPVFGIKGATGHTLGAAGVVETIACVLALSDEYLPPTTGYRKGSAGLDVTETARAGKISRILNVNSGFGGINAAVVVERDF